MGTENALHMVGEVSSAEDAKQKDMKRNGRQKVRGRLTFNLTTAETDGDPSKMKNTADLIDLTLNAFGLVQASDTTHLKKKTITQHKL